jgi:type IV fimbrial biogenesis protein FimT
MKQRGYSIMELMVVLALAGTILAIGAPSFAEFRANGRLTSMANDFLTTVAVARSEAVKRRVSVSICPSANPTAFGATCTVDDTMNGWIAFVDTNGNCARNVAVDPIVSTGRRDHESAAGATNGDCLSFGADGFRRVVAGVDSISRVVFCDERGNEFNGDPANNRSYARGVEVLATGRAAVEIGVDTIGSWDAGATPVSCPSF